MAAHFEGESLRGFASFMRKQHLEEQTHAMKIFDFLLDRGGRASPGAIAAPTTAFDSPRAVFAAAYEREKANTKSIHEVYQLAVELKDYAAESMLSWFVDEQVEEENWCQEVLALLDRAGDHPAAMLMLDDRYGKLAVT